MLEYKNTWEFSICAVLFQYILQKYNCWNQSAKHCLRLLLQTFSHKHLRDLEQCTDVHVQTLNTYTPRSKHLQENAQQQWNHTFFFFFFLLLKSFYTKWCSAEHLMLGFTTKDQKLTKWPNRSQWDIQMNPRRIVTCRQSFVHWDCLFFSAVSLSIERKKEITPKRKVEFIWSHTVLAFIGLNMHIQNAK